LLAGLRVMVCLSLFDAELAKLVSDYHSSYDEFAPLGPDRAHRRRFCAAGVKVDHVEAVLGEHIGTGLSGAPGAVAYLAARFAGPGLSSRQTGLTPLHSGSLRTPSGCNPLASRPFDGMHRTLA
jgi:hypothetical protein